MKKIVWHSKIKLWEITRNNGHQFFISLNGKEIASQYGITIENHVYPEYDRSGIIN